MTIVLTGNIAWPSLGLSEHLCLGEEAYSSITHLAERRLKHENKIDILVTQTLPVMQDINW